MKKQVESLNKKIYATISKSTDISVKKCIVLKDEKSEIQGQEDKMKFEQQQSMYRYMNNIYHPLWLLYMTFVQPMLIWERPEMLVQWIKFIWKNVLKNYYSRLKHLFTEKETIQDYTIQTLSTWRPEVLSFLQQMEWSPWGKSLQLVEQNFHTYLETPSGKKKKKKALN